VRPGRDVTLIASMKMVHEAAAAAAELAKDGIEVEIIDLRTLRPWDQPAVLSAVAKTRRAVVAMEAPRLGGPAAEISATLAEELFEVLAAPVQRVGALDAPIPMAPALEQALLPGKKDILAAVRKAMAYTPQHQDVQA